MATLRIGNAIYPNASESSGAPTPGRYSVEYPNARQPPPAPVLEIEDDDPNSTADDGTLNIDRDPTDDNVMSSAANAYPPPGGLANTLPASLLEQAGADDAPDDGTDGTTDGTNPTPAGTRAARNRRR